MGENMGVNSVIDDFGAVADWAMLKPVGQVLSLVSTPLTLDDKNDCERLWDRTRTKAMVTAANLFPDSILQVILMANYFTVVFSGTTPLRKAELVGSMLCTSAVAAKTALDLILINTRLTTWLGFGILLLLLFPFIRIILAFACTDHMFAFTTMSCVA